MNISKCNNVRDIRKLAKKRLPKPIFDYIDGGSDDEETLRNNTESFNNFELIPNVLRDVSSVDTKVNVLGSTIDFPFFCSPTALQKLFHHMGEIAVAKAAESQNTMFGVSSLSTTSVEDISKIVKSPKLFQFYYHKDKSLNKDMLNRAKAANFDALALTVDTAVGGNRERDLKSGFTIPPRLTLGSLMSFLFHMDWTLNFLFRKFDLPHLSKFHKNGSSLKVNVGQYFTEMIDQSMSWKDAENLRSEWNGPFCIKGIMSVEDAKKALDIGATAIMISNHGGRQLDGSISPIEQLSSIVDAIGGEIEIILDGGVRRGSHILKALSLGATACSGGRLYLYALAAAGQIGVEKALINIRKEIERDMKLMGVNKISDLNSKMINKKI
ncbi:MAG: putative L-lactate dehydrogenase [Alphaproteobacteria bacterium MarineAlpha2_Bin1]|nr:MAG: putative L-lactate dehydrogenase [Alphaproteobacteria bacterium MarineAlpha2_Bin1]